LALASGLGALRIMYGSPTNICDIVPVDVVVNSLLCVSYKTAITTSPQQTVQIYQCASSKSNPCTWGKYVKISNGFWTRNVPKSRAQSKFWGPPWTLLVPSKSISVFSRSIIHQTPALLGDMTKVLKGQQANYIKQVNGLHSIADSLSYFTSFAWIFSSTNLLNLSQTLTPVDKEIFSIDLSPHRMNWEIYILLSCRGTLRFLIKDDGPPIEHIPQYQIKSKL